MNLPSFPTSISPSSSFFTPPFPPFSLLYSFYSNSSFFLLHLHLLLSLSLSLFWFVALESHPAMLRSYSQLCAKGQLNLGLPVRKHTQPVRYLSLIPIHQNLLGAFHEASLKVIFAVVVLLFLSGTKPRISYMQGLCSATEWRPWPFFGNDR